MNGVKRLILASESPRRKELLKQMGAVFEAITSNYDERLDDERSVDEVVCELALGKAEAVAKQYPDAFVIGSDTVVVLDGRQLGKSSRTKMPPDSSCENLAAGQQKSLLPLRSCARHAMCVKFAKSVPPSRFTPTVTAL